MKDILHFLVAKNSPNMHWSLVRRKRTIASTRTCAMVPELGGHIAARQWC